VFESFGGEIVNSGAATVQVRRGGGTRAPRAQNNDSPPLDVFIARIGCVTRENGDGQSVWLAVAMVAFLTPMRSRNS
jgi:hypothetical protein